MSTHPDPEQLSAYIDGELTGDERDDLEQHLTGCSECSATLRALRATVAEMRALPAPVPSEQESWALRAAITKARKRPATLYGRWTVAVGGVAAIAITVVALANIGHKNPTVFGETASGSGAAPKSALAADSAASLIEIDGTNYTHASASQLLNAPTPQAAPMAPSATSPTAVAGRLGAPGAASHTSNGAPITDAQRAAYLTAIQGCEKQVLPNTTSILTPLRYIVGTYERTPVFFLIYQVPSGSETKIELWVVQRADCYIRFFVPPR
jgi:anti-sigma factor RsiW